MHRCSELVAHKRYPHRRSWLAAAGLTCLLAASCSNKDDGDADDDAVTVGSSGSGDGSALALDDDDDTKSDTGSGGAGGDDAPPQREACEELVGLDLSECGSSGSFAKQRDVSMLLVMDISKSMLQEFSTDSSTRKWAGLKDALSRVVKATDDEIAFGLELYPYDESGNYAIREDCQGNACCSMPIGHEMQVAVAPGASEEIIEVLEGANPNGGTPTAAALRRALDYFDSSTIDGDRYVLLATDGGPNCNLDVSCEASGCTRNIEGICEEPEDGNCCDGADIYQLACVDDEATLSAIEELADAGIHTYVVGIPGSEAYAEYLDGFAEAGGRPAPEGDTSYYQVTSSGGAEALAETFLSITQDLVQSCELPLEAPAPDLEKINVAINCSAIPATDGDEVNWEYIDDGDGPRIEFKGSYCDTIEEAGVERVDVLLGCPRIEVT